jgi:Rrf2 family nitric oxide-sensitive transcriptional repressor
MSKLRFPSKEHGMQLTRYTDYGLRVLIYLALSSRGGTVGEIADSYGISKNHLLKVANRLGQLGFVNATRGKSGGLKLAQEAAAINIADVVSKMEPNLDLVECFDVEKNTCPIAGICELESALGKAQTAFMDVLQDYSLADVVATRSELIQVLQPKT